MTILPRRSRVALLTALLATAVFIAMLPTAARATDPKSTLGVFVDTQDPTGVQGFEDLIGRPRGTIPVVHSTLGNAAWSQISDETWFITRWLGTPYNGRVIYTVPMLTKTGATLASGARGAYDQYFRSLAQHFIDNGRGDVTISLGPEFNGTWFAWKIGVANGPADYVKYWKRIVDAMRAVPGAHFKFAWTVMGGSYGGGSNPVLAYPGDTYVDYIGSDVYDQSTLPNQSPSQLWADVRDGPNGLNWLRQFGGQHRKQIMLPEWGLNRAAGGGGDDPNFIISMYNWIRSSQTVVAHHMYFQSNDGAGINALLFTGATPNADAAFRQYFGGP